MGVKPPLASPKLCPPSPRSPSFRSERRAPGTEPAQPEIGQQAAGRETRQRDKRGGQRGRIRGYDEGWSGVRVCGTLAAWVQEGQVAESKGCPCTGRKDIRESRIYSSRLANIRGDALPGGNGAGIVEAAVRKRRCPGCPAPQAQPCQDPEPAAGLQKKPHPCGMLPSQEPSQPARGQACQATRCWK